MSQRLGEFSCAVLAWALLTPIAVKAQPNAGPNQVEITAEHVLSINGEKKFTIGFTMPPKPDAKAPNGKLAFAELRDAGALFVRTGPMSDVMGEGHAAWTDAWIAQERKYMAAAAATGMYCIPYLRELSAIAEGDREREQQLRRVIRMFRDDPGLGAWKGADEPQWAGDAVAPLVRAHQIIAEEDPHHPLWIVQAPRGTVDDCKPYNPAYDIAGVDVYPVSYPPGLHLIGPEENREMSMVGDYTRKMMAVVGGRKPIWLTLQIAWSGVEPPVKTLRFPTFAEQRFMTYEAIINGARGLVYFGGAIRSALSEEDKRYGWNWTYWNRVLRPVIEEVGDRGALAEALCAADSARPVKVTGSVIEFCVREIGPQLFVLACCREPQKTALVTFTGLPPEVSEGEVLYESPRKVNCHDGSFSDWFAPYEVHAYRFSRQRAAP